MISTKSFLHDRFVVNNSKHNLLKYNINVINKIYRKEIKFVHKLLINARNLLTKISFCQHRSLHSGVKYINDITNDNVNILKQVFNLAIIKFKNNKKYRLFDYTNMVAKIFGIIDDNTMYFSAFRNIYSCYHIEFKNQLHFDQNIFEITNEISIYCFIKKHNKYTQLWLINNCKKLKNN